MPAYVPFVFAFTTFLTIEAFARATRTPARVRFLLVVWIGVQGLIAASGFYGETDALPPRLLLAIGPPILTLVLLFTTSAGRAFVDSLDLRTLTWMHTVRVPVELVLFWLFQAGMVPELMTFEGVNFDILSGLTAPIAALFLFRKNRPQRGPLFVWNVICLGLVANIMTRGVLSVPTPFQQFGFEQPNVGLMMFPYIWLPALIVPLVLLAHFAAFRQLSGQRSAA